MRQRRVWSRNDQVTARMVLTRNSHVDTGPVMGDTIPVNASEMRRGISRERMEHNASSRMVLKAKKAHHRSRSRELRFALAKPPLVKRPTSRRALPASASRVKPTYICIPCRTVDFKEVISASTKRNPESLVSLQNSVEPDSRYAPGRRRSTAPARVAKWSLLTFDCTAHTEISGETSLKLRGRTPLIVLAPS